MRPNRHPRHATIIGTSEDGRYWIAHDGTLFLRAPRNPAHRGLKSGSTDFPDHAEKLARRSVMQLDVAESVMQLDTA